MKDDILIRYINKHCTATEEKEVLEWLKEKDSRQRLFELEQIWRSEEHTSELQSH